MKKIIENNANRISNIKKKVETQTYIHVSLTFSYFYNKNKVLIYFKVILDIKYNGVQSYKLVF